MGSLGGGQVWWESTAADAEAGDETCWKKQAQLRAIEWHENITQSPQVGLHILDPIPFTLFK